jgi:hypothetical protein
VAVRRRNASTNEVNSFRPKKFCDHSIVDIDGYTVGHVRVKPSSILWKPADGKRWRGVALQKFESFMEKNGRLQTK